jgi:hypothetical protein
MSIGDDPEDPWSMSLHDETTPPDDAGVANIPDDKTPEPSLPPVKYHGRWDEEGEADKGNPSGHAGDEETDDDMPNSEDVRYRESLLQSTLPMLLAAQKMIQNIKEACMRTTSTTKSSWIDYDIQPPKLNCSTPL